MYAGGPGFFIFFHETQISGGGGYPVIYRQVSDRATKKIIKKVKRYVEAKREINPESITAIVESMIDTWPKSEVSEFMDAFSIPQAKAVSQYRIILRQFFDDGLALILILASV